MTSWLLLAEAGATAGSTEGGLFDLDATLPLMAVQVVLLTFLLNALFFRPVGKAVEDREIEKIIAAVRGAEKAGNSAAIQAGLERLGGIDLDELVFEHVREGLPLSLIHI